MTESEIKKFQLLIWNITGRLPDPEEVRCFLKGLEEFIDRRKNDKRE
jgi:hypothetical protein